jgi:hypothetical protein
MEYLAALTQPSSNEKLNDLLKKSTSSLYFKWQAFEIGVAQITVNLGPLGTEEGTFSLADVNEFLENTLLAEIEIKETTANQVVFRGVVHSYNQELRAKEGASATFVLADSRWVCAYVTKFAFSLDGKEKSWLEKLVGKDLQLDLARYQPTTQFEKAHGVFVSNLWQTLRTHCIRTGRYLMAWPGETKVACVHPSEWLSQPPTGLDFAEGVKGFQLQKDASLALPQIKSQMYSPLDKNKNVFTSLLTSTKDAPFPFPQDVLKKKSLFNVTESDAKRAKSRGQGAHSWRSPKKTITLNLAFFPGSLKASGVFRLNPPPHPSYLKAESYRAWFEGNWVVGSWQGGLSSQNSWLDLELLHADHLRQSAEGFEAGQANEGEPAPEKLWDEMELVLSI